MDLFPHSPPLCHHSLKPYDQRIPQAYLYRQRDVPTDIQLPLVMHIPYFLLVFGYFPLRCIVLRGNDENAKSRYPTMSFAILLISIV